MSARVLGLALLVVGCAGAAETPPLSPFAAAESALRGSDTDLVLPVPDDLRSGVAAASSLGASLFILDVSTAVAWDALGARIGPPTRAGLAHYLAFIGTDDEGEPDGSVQVLFFTDEHVPRLAYRVRVLGGPSGNWEVIQQDPPLLVHEPLMTLLNARLLALEALPPTGQVVNPVLLPQREGTIVIYLLAASSQPNTAVLGRHYRVEVSSDGSEVERLMVRSGPELIVPTRDASGQRLSALTVTDAATEHPTEAHVFASRMANLPIYVTTGRGLWKVRASAIEYLGRP